MNGKARPSPIDSAWVRLLDVEQQLEAEIAAAVADARSRVEEARAKTASVVPEPAAMAALAAAEERADIEQHQSDLAHIAAGADAVVDVLAGVPDSLIDELAQVALGAVLSDAIPAERP